MYLRLDEIGKIVTFSFEFEKKRVVNYNAYFDILSTKLYKSLNFKLKR